MSAASSAEEQSRQHVDTLLLATVGSDHHPFDRLIRWLDSWLDTVSDVRAVIQYGTAKPPSQGEGMPFVPHAELQRLMSEASIIVAQGGPYSVLESVEHGRIPIVVPRRRALGEVVDDHQHAFCSLMADRGEAVVATTEAELHEALDRALTLPEQFVVTAQDREVDRQATVDRFAEWVGVLRSRQRRAWWSQSRWRR